MSVESHFAKKDPSVRETYRRVLDAARMLGPVTEEAKKTSIHLVRRTAFAEKTCPNCRAKLTTADWVEMCLRSTPMGGRFVRPCRRCGALLRQSISTYVAATSTLAAAVFSTTDLVFGRLAVPPLLALAFVTAGFIATLSMHLEIVPLEYVVREP